MRNGDLHESLVFYFISTLSVCLSSTSKSQDKTHAMTTINLIQVMPLSRFYLSSALQDTGVRCGKANFSKSKFEENIPDSLMWLIQDCNSFWTAGV